MKLIKPPIQDRCLKGLLRRLEGWAVALAAGGVVVGYALSEYRLHSIIVTINQAHREEIQRLVESYGRGVNVAASDVAAAAAAVGECAGGTR